MGLPIVLKSLTKSAARGSRRSRSCLPSSQPGPKEKTETAPHVFSRVSREKDRRLHLPEAICSDNWAQTTSVPTALVCVGPCHPAHMCRSKNCPVSALCRALCGTLYEGSRLLRSLFAPKSYTYSQVVSWSQRGPRVGVQVDGRGLKPQLVIVGNGAEGTGTASVLAVLASRITSVQLCYTPEIKL